MHVKFKEHSRETVKYGTSMHPEKPRVSIESSFQPPREISFRLAGIKKKIPTPDQQYTETTGVPKYFSQVKKCYLMTD